MQAITFDRFGGPDVLALRERPDPGLRRGEVLVAPRAVSINVIDSRIRRGMMWPLVNNRFPKIPGSDFAGTVVDVGPGVTAFSKGARVFGATDPLKGGAFARLVAAPDSQLATLPPALSFEEGAAIPITALAALYSLRDLGRAEPGQSVLIHGASGSLGLFAVQIARLLGLVATAVSGPSGLARLRELEVERVIDYSTRDASRFDATFDIIVNASGKFPFAVGKRFLKPAGRLIEPSPTIPVFIGSMAANLLRRKKHLVLTTTPRRSELEYLARLVEQGQLKPTIAETVPLDRAATGFARAEKGGVAGKIVVTI